MGSSNDAKLTDSELEQKFKAFKTDSFDPNALVKPCRTEKEIRQLCSSLLSLKKSSAEELRISVYSDYTSFTRMSKEVANIEDDMLSVRSLLSTQIALVHDLSEKVHNETLSSCHEHSIVDDIPYVEDREPTDAEKWLVEFPDMLTVFLAERRVDEALDALDKGEGVAGEARENKTLNPAALSLLQAAITEGRQRLSDYLVEVASQPSICGAELRATVLAIKRLGDGFLAHTLLLDAHDKRFEYNMQNLCPLSASYGQAYTACLSRLVLSAIAQASSDSLAVFGKDPAYEPELFIWSAKKIEAFAFLVKRDVIPSLPASGGLRAVVECVQIALGHCSLLEDERLDLYPILLEIFRPSVEKAVEANFKRIEKKIASLVAVDDWVLTYPPSVTHTNGCSDASFGCGTAPQPKLSCSAHLLNSLVQEFIETVGPLHKMELGGPVLEGMFQVFSFYVSLLINALPASVDDEANMEDTRNKVVRMAVTEAQQIVLLANASLLADELLPHAANKLAALNGKDVLLKSASDIREWRRRLQRCVDLLRDSFCRQHALDLIFTEDYDTRISADMYIRMDEDVNEYDWLPSPIFQELFIKLNRVASIAAVMLSGREKFTTLLLMRLTETVILWISDDHHFWDVIEGPKPLGPLGLKQIWSLLFHFSSQGNFLSRHLHQVIKGNMSRAMDAFATAGVDPSSVLPEDEWFVDISQEAIYRLNGKSILFDGHQYPRSPTTSISAYSMLSV
ncbi:exocyst complex component EXO84B-like protein [Cinnamomum micranthum f. kanehirae]|uniref:Exocyst complex component EXO84B-like protein n=1 Tax=Cinnamomum micranthum f. kanehirae TaxID=337451 RepID=A0A3S3M366_9MAGN|nr:exocyst complex component EXO84B-like protein [Cinnamomum micranthum f. kanehirae]